MVSCSFLVNLSNILMWSISSSTSTVSNNETLPSIDMFPQGSESIQSHSILFTLLCESLAQFSSVAQSCPTLCDPMDCSTPGFPIHHQLPELTQTDVHQVGDAIQPSHPLSSPSHLQSFPASGSFPMSQFFASGGWSIGASALASVLPMNIQDGVPLGLTGLISLQSKGLSRVFSNTTVQKYQLFSTQLSL